MLHLRTRLSTLGLIVFAGALSACSLNTEVLGVGQVSVYGGDNQTAAANAVFPEALAVLVVSQFGEPMENVEVSWSVASGAGTLSSATTLTDANGVASVTYTAGPTPGHASIVAQVHGVEPLSFDETIT
jgi:hypothetical protein